MEVTGQDPMVFLSCARNRTKNSLGKGNFFPNSFNIYFHDTPAKDLFNRERRAYSHGCIRLSEPEKWQNIFAQSTAWTRIELSRP
jgi:murein L,D-transpeptidase YcbB/YkuD